VIVSSGSDASDGAPAVRSDFAARGPPRGPFVAGFPREFFAEDFFGEDFFGERCFGERCFGEGLGIL
jgi:hypothetical protein